jgi:hypothetical protein
MALALWISVVPSFYFVQSSIFISTDIPAATIYLVFLYLIAFHSRTIVATSLSAAALVFWRQSYAPVLAASVFANTDRLRSTPVGPLLLTLALPGVILSFYIFEFGGLAPRNSIVEHLPDPVLQIGWKGLNFGVFPQSILHAFAFLGLVSLIYLTILITGVQAAYRTNRTIIVGSVASLLVAVVWVAVPSTFDLDAGRWGSVVWSLGQIGPIWGNRSLIVLLLGIIGAAFMASLMHLALSRDETRPVGLGMLLYIAGQILMPLAYQRYIEPVVLISLALIAASTVTVAGWRMSLFASIFALYSLAGLLHIYGMLPDIWPIASFGSACSH